MQPCSVQPCWRNESAPGFTTQDPEAGDPLARNDSSTRQTLIFDDNQMASSLYGEGDRTLRILEQELGIDAKARGNEVRLVGQSEEVGLARKVLEELYGEVRSGHPVRAADVRQAVRMASQEPDVDPANLSDDVLSAVVSRRRIVAKNLAQREYIEAMRTKDVVIGALLGAAEGVLQCGGTERASSPWRGKEELTRPLAAPVRPELFKQTR